MYVPVTRSAMASSTAAAARSTQQLGRVAAVATHTHQPMFQQKRTAGICRASSSSSISIRRQWLHAAPVARPVKQQQQEQQGPTPRRISGICRVLTESAQLEIGSKAPEFEVRGFTAVQRLFVAPLEAFVRHTCQAPGIARRTPQHQRHLRWP